MIFELSVFSVRMTRARLRAAMMLKVDHKYQLYTTSLPREEFAPRELAALYSNRWSVETFIQELKEVLGLKVTPVCRKAAVECLFYDGVGYITGRIHPVDGERLQRPRLPSTLSE